MTLIRSIDEFKGVSLHIDFKRIMHYIEHVELRYVNSLLGDELYADLQKKNSDNRANNLLLIEKLKPAIAYYAYAEAIMNESDKLTPTGLVNKINDYSSPVDGQTLMFKHKKSCRDADFFIAEALDFLKENSDKYPLWKQNYQIRGCKSINISFL